MSSLLISVLNVIVVLGSIVLAVYVGSKPRAVLYSLGMVAVGVAAYIFEIYSAIAAGECSGLGNAILEFVVGASKCIGIGGRFLGHAQILILAGTLVLAFRPLAKSG